MALMLCKSYCPKVLSCLLLLHLLNAQCAFVLHPKLFNKYIRYQRCQTHNSLFEFTACFLSLEHTQLISMCTSLHNLKERICHRMCWHAALPLKKTHVGRLQGVCTCIFFLSCCKCGKVSYLESCVGGGGGVGVGVGGCWLSCPVDF